MWIYSVCNIFRVVLLGRQENQEILVNSSSFPTTCHHNPPKTRPGGFGPEKTGLSTLLHCLKCASGMFEFNQAIVFRRCDRPDWNYFVFDSIFPVPPWWKVDVGGANWWNDMDHPHWNLHEVGKDGTRNNKLQAGVRKVAATVSKVDGDAQIKNRTD